MMRSIINLADESDSSQCYSLNINETYKSFLIRAYQSCIVIAVVNIIMCFCACMYTKMGVYVHI